MIWDSLRQVLDEEGSHCAIWNTGHWVIVESQIMVTHCINDRHHEELVGFGEVVHHE